jgi:hypothetical protein
LHTNLKAGVALSSASHTPKSTNLLTTVGVGLVRPNAFSRFGDLLQQPTPIGSAIRNYWKQTGGGWFPPYWLPIVFGFSLLKNTTSYHFHCIKVLFIKHYFFSQLKTL